MLTSHICAIQKTLSYIMNKLRTSVILDSIKKFVCLKDCWDRGASNIISRRWEPFLWSAVFRKCRRRRRLQLVHRLPPGGDLLHEHVTTSTWSPRPALTGKIFVWLPASLLEPGSTRYSSAPSITTVWLHITTSLKSISQKRWVIT